MHALGSLAFEAAAAAFPALFYAFACFLNKAV